MVKRIKKIDISPDASSVYRNNAIYCLENYGDEYLDKYFAAFDTMLLNLKNNPEIGSNRLQDIPDKYRAIHLWEHLWVIYQIYYKEQVIKIEYIIDDRQDYGWFVK